jgi:hypothetical protein
MIKKEEVFKTAMVLNFKTNVDSYTRLEEFGGALMNIGLDRKIMNYTDFYNKISSIIFSIISFFQTLPS